MFQWGSTLEQRAQLTILNGGDNRKIAVDIKHMSPCVIQIVSKEEIPVNATIRIDLSNSMLLAEVSHSGPNGGVYGCRAEVEHSLVAVNERVADLVRDLMSLNGNLRNSGTPSPAALNSKVAPRPPAHTQSSGVFTRK